MAPVRAAPGTKNGYSAMYGIPADPSPAYVGKRQPQERVRTSPAQPNSSRRGRGPTKKKKVSKQKINYKPSQEKAHRQRHQEAALEAELSKLNQRLFHNFSSLAIKHHVRVPVGSHSNKGKMRAPKAMRPVPNRRGAKSTSPPNRRQHQRSPAPVSNAAGRRYANF